jgi:hypothetical protein
LSSDARVFSGKPPSGLKSGHGPRTLQRNAHNGRLLYYYDDIKKTRARHRGGAARRRRN